jgi:methylenetetrahydrofolate reductase (NADPH)
MGPFDDALAVIRSGLLAEYGIRRVGIAGYPEGHPDIPAERLWQALADKHRVLLDMGHEPIVTTQFAFDAEALVGWIGGVRDRGITSTIRLGVPGPATVRALLRFAARCGVGASAKVMRKYGISLARLMNVAGPDRLVEDLASSLDPVRHGDVRIHLYPFGGLERTAEWATTMRVQAS